MVSPVGKHEGLREDVGRIVGKVLGFLPALGVNVVGQDGTFEGKVDGVLVNVNDGITLGPLEGDLVGFLDGAEVGMIDIKNEGIAVGNFDGT